MLRYIAERYNSASETEINDIKSFLGPSFLPIIRDILNLEVTVLTPLNSTRIPVKQVIRSYL